jgi:SAM-dependent methyltransferase
MSQFTYVGTELELFAQAKNWKNYVSVLLGRYIKGDVLEVGAGIGSNTRLLCGSNYRQWFCLEPDRELFYDLKNKIEVERISNCYAENGTIAILNKEQLFDTILYLDVLEHIERDREEIIKASQHLKPNGNLIVLAPAHQWLFTRFDCEIGHYRRYNKTMLKSIVPNELDIVKLIYLDSVGLLASLGNKLLLKQSQPTLKQIKAWERLMVPLSRKIDPIIGYRLGKSILLVVKK